MDYEDSSAWDLRYSNHKTGWDRGTSSPILQSWIEQGDLAPCRILIPGCGNGYEVILLAQLGFTVTAIDFAEAPVQFLKQQLKTRQLQATVIQEDLLEWQPEGLFDAIYEQTCLCALHPDLWSRYETLLRQWLTPEGKLLALFMQTGKEGGPPYHCDLKAMQTLFPKQHWNWQKNTSVKQPHPSGLTEISQILTPRHPRTSSGGTHQKHGDII